MENTDQGDWMSEVKAFDETKTGVKGLVDSGITTIPRIFIANEYGPTFNNPNKLISIHNDDGTLSLGDQIIEKKSENLALPVIDLHGLSDESSREKVVEEIRQASESWGFFQVINHGIPLKLLDELIDGVMRFNEQDTEVKKQYYSRDTTKKFRYVSNLNLYSAPVVNWKDTIICIMHPNNRPNPEEIHETCRDIFFDYANQVTNLGMTLLELFSEGVGLERGHLKEMKYAEGIALMGHYQPPCPQPELAMGNISHCDRGLFTILLQDQLGGLQVEHSNQWVDVVPIRGALIINIADLMQLITNDKFRSVKHRVLVQQKGPRISFSCSFLSNFLNEENGKSIGPIKELLNEYSPPVYRESTTDEYLTVTYYSQSAQYGNSSLAHFKIAKD